MMHNRERKSKEKQQRIPRRLDNKFRSDMRCGGYNKIFPGFPLELCLQGKRISSRFYCLSVLSLLGIEAKSNNLNHFLGSFILQLQILSILYENQWVFDSICELFITIIIVDMLSNMTQQRCIDEKSVLVCNI